MLWKKLIDDIIILWENMLYGCDFRIYVWEEGSSARKISLHPMHLMLLKASGDRNEGRKLKNDNLPKRVS